MSVSALFGSLFRVPSSRKRGRRQSGPRHWAARLQRRELFLEPLEDRRLLSLNVMVIGPATANPNTDVQYDIRVTNPKTIAATNVKVTDAVPSGMSYVSAVAPAGWTATSPAVGGTSGNVQFVSTGGTIPAGGTRDFLVTFHVLPTDRGGSTITDKASVTSSLGWFADSGSTKTAVNLTTLTISAVGSPDPVSPGGPLTYSINVTNTGTTNAYNVDVSDATPSYTTFASAAAPAGWTATGPSVGRTGTLHFTAAVLPAGTSATLTWVANVNPSVSGDTTITNRATVSSPTDPSGSHSVTTQNSVAGQAHLSITKLVSAGLDSKGNVIAGTDLTYTITVTNSGPSAAKNVTLTETTPAGATFVSASTPLGWTVTSAGSTGTLIETDPSLAAGATATFTYKVHVNPSATAGSTISNTATVASPTDPAGSHSSVSTTAVNTQATLAVSKKATGGLDSKGNAVAGTDLAYTITVTNNGPSDAKNVTLTDGTPTGTEFVSASTPAGWTVTSAGGTGTLIESDPALAAGATATFTYTVHVSPSAAAGSKLSNTATVASPTDPAGSHASTVATTVDVQANLSVSKIVTSGLDSNGSAVAGTDLTYTITVTNNGPSDAKNVTMTDATPTSTTFVSASTPAGWTVTSAGSTGTLVETDPNLALGATATFTYIAHVNPSAAGGSKINNTATVASPSDATGPHSSTATATVAAQAEVSVTASGPASLIAGQAATYTFVVTNAGPSDAAGVSLTNPLPAHTNFISETHPTGFTATVPAPGAAAPAKVIWNIKTLAIGASATMTVLVNTDGSVEADTSIINNVSVLTTTPNLSTQTSAEVTTALNLSGMTTQTNPFDRTKTDLVIGGTAGDDVIKVAATLTGVQVSIGGQTFGPYNPTGRILAFGRGGNDTITVAPLISTAAWLFGGSGTNTLVGGSGSNLLVGGDGADTISGGIGRNVLIGGKGADQLFALFGDALMIADSTDYGNNLVALNAIFAEWSRTDASYLIRVNNLRHGGGLNGSIALNATTVHDDQALDTLLGGIGQSWFLAHASGAGTTDLVIGQRTTGATAELLDNTI